MVSEPPPENYTDALDQLGLDYDVWDVETLGSPTATDLATYRTVLWRIAEYSTTQPTGLSFPEQAAIRSYLDSGGAQAPTARSTALTVPRTRGSRGVTP